MILVTLEDLASIPFQIWFLIGAALVFFMQAGFAMVETGFTRAKNAGNIIMKNLMDFCIGTVMFAFLGYGLMMGEHVFFGLIGKPSLQLFTDFQNFDFSSFVFNLVFAATAATIVSGAMAERTKFSAYCIYSAIISLVVYPIEAGWVWGGGWLAELGFVDFAGSAAIHTVGGVSSIVGAIILGPRLGKYITDPKTGKKTSRAIPGHSLTLGALGCFILWFGWYGFNGAAATDIRQLGSILLVTTIAPAVATCATMIFTWVKNGKPDVSMSLNGSLAGLVAITAPCSNVDALGAFIIGAVAGILVVVAVEFIDLKLHVDDPVGAIAVHGANGIWGTLAVGLFANPNVPNAVPGVTGEAATGLFYGGGAEQLGIQLLGILAIVAWTVFTMTIVFYAIKKFNGLRASAEDELTGLDISEHGLASSYADFVTTPDFGLTADGAVPAPAVAADAVPAEKAVKVVDVSSPGTKITKAVIITNQSKFEGLKLALDKIGITGMTVTQVLGCGMQRGGSELYRGVPLETRLLPKVKVEIVISKVPTKLLVDTVKKALYTGRIGDGKIFIYDVENVIKVRTGEEGYDALQDNT